MPGSLSCHVTSYWSREIIVGCDWHRYVVWVMYRDDFVLLVKSLKYLRIRLLFLKALNSHPRKAKTANIFFNARPDRCYQRQTR